ncbi:hypothetical protein RJZ56_001970 [Blastomyces dermatitidis]|uniref:Pre-mRNA splicing factor CLF1 n=2 Tax=Blastomyces TaxID=229219 RepID=A0A179UR83_BLAGS|nr:uncharacterized protein BDBG_05964 [Blastomyces gilchristii SLH14081]EGE80753.1 pre-mRNA splicing factor CLF1 [Blastomyces dermatitidis ATCC 18188]OAT10303.1 hypothetical protein BDBG_05964 [Blastomyces gilchristii SLH14081]
MSLPKPPVELRGHCSVVHDNVLYIYTRNAFISLPLKLDGEWSKLPMGVPVSNAACTLGGVDGNPNDPGIYVVGGKSDSPDYSGIQLYSLKAKKWRTLELRDNNKDIKNRIHHDAIYLTASSSLLVFAGSQGGNIHPSTQTFLIPAAPPHAVESFMAPVDSAVDPFLLPWREDSAFMVGGGPTNTKTYTFSKAEGWRDTGVPLVQPLPEKSKVQCAMLSGADGSRVLELFDVSKSPNSVSRYVMLRAGGVPARPGEQIGGSASRPTKRQRRDVTLADFPKYDNENAPSTTLNDFSLAQDGNGLVVISGRDDDYPVRIFDQSKNSWVDTKQLLLGDNAKITSSTSTSIPTTSSSTSFPSSSASIEPTPSSTSVAGLVPGASNKRTLTIVGATLGAILGVAALLILILLFIGWRKRRNRYMNRGKDGYQEDKDRLSFQDQGMEPLTRSIEPMARGPVPSTNSWAIVSGQVDDRPPKSSIPMRPSPALGAVEKEMGGKSPLRQIQTTDLPGENTISLPGDEDATRGDRRTDEGWSKYFQGDNERKLAGDTSARSSAASSQMTKSDYRNSDWPTISTNVAPLKINQLNNAQPIGRVLSGSPSTEHPPRLGDSIVMQQGLTAKISSADSISIASDDYEDDRYSSAEPATIHENTGWSATGGHHFPGERVASSNYSGSLFQLPFINQAKSERPVTLWPSNAPESSSTQDLSKPDKSANSDMSWLNLKGTR